MEAHHIILSTYFFAGEHERFAHDVGLPESGQEMKVNLPDGSCHTGTLVSAERVDDQRIRVSIEVPTAVTTGLYADPSHFSF